jgi:hypothetical protein
VSATNPTGISRSQVKKVLALQRAKRKDPDLWSTGSIAHASGSTEKGYHHPRVLMLRSSSSSSTAVYDGTPPHSETSDSSDSSDVDYTPVKFIPPRAKSCAFILTPSIDVARLIKTYLESVRPTDNGDLHAGAQYNGQYTMPQYRGYWNDDDFMTFSPLGPPYIQPGYPGSYVSTTEDLNTFSSHIVDLDTLESNFMTTTMHQLLYLAILFDFMAFTAQTFRQVLGSKPSSAANLKAIRDLMLENLSTMDATFDDDLYSLTITQSKAVVLEIEPTPPLPGTSPSVRSLPVSCLLLPLETISRLPSLPDMRRLTPLILHRQQQPRHPTLVPSTPALPQALHRPRSPLHPMVITRTLLLSRPKHCSA